jgi:CHAT domain-containing protein/Tfp pilus assembly protein PilF
MVALGHFACAIVLAYGSAAAQTGAGGSEALAANLLNVTQRERAALLARPDYSTIDVIKALMALGNKAKVEDEFARAAIAFELAEIAARKVADTEQLGAALNGRVESLFRLTELDRAKAIAEESVRVHEARQDANGQGEAWNWIGNIHYYKAEYPEAGEAFRKAQESWTSSGNRRGVARTLNNLGNIKKGLGDQDEAATHYEQALAIFQDLGDRTLAAVVTDNIAAVHGNRGDYPQALEYAARALSISEEVGSRAWMAKSLDSLGNIYAAQGAYSRALEALHRSLTLRKILGDNLAIAESENNIGIVYFAQGEYQLAIDAYKRSLRLASRAGAAGTHGPVALINIGAAAWRLGQTARAHANLQESLALSDRLGMKRRSAECLDTLGRIALEQGNMREAGAMLNRALAAHEAMGDQAGVAESLNSLARLGLATRRFSEALDFAQRSTTIAERYGHNDRLWESYTLTGMAYHRLGQTDAARTALSNAVAVVEQLRNEVAGLPLGRERFFENKLSPYHQLLALALEGNSVGEALEIAERAKGRVLAEMIQTRDAGLAAGITAEERRDEHRLQMALRSVNQRILAERTKTSPEEARIRALDDERRSARSEYEAFRNALYARHPELRVTRGEAAPFALKDAGAILPDASTAVLDYVVADDAVYLFVLARPHGSVELQYSRLKVGRKSLASRVRRLRERLASRDLLFQREARELHDLLLAPAARLLAGRTRLVIVPDGPLWETPFQALQDQAGRYLIQSAAVSYAPSLTILRESLASPSRRNGPPTLLAMGKANFGAKGARPAVLMSDLAPLPEAERQVRQLSALYGPEHRATYLGNDATEDRFKIAAPRYRIVHVASHGLFEENSPLYSSVVLSRGDEPSAEDGLLEAWELLNLKLDADLVILSACETGRGRIAFGEGIVGTMWALFAAGAKATVASQWKVEASSTTELMVAFHRRLSSGEGEKVDHLRQATLEVMRNPRYAHPFYWAPFVLVGNPF